MTAAVKTAGAGGTAMLNLPRFDYPLLVAALLLLGDEALGERLEVRPRARIVAAATASDDPLQVLSGCVAATRKLMAEQGLDAGDVDALGNDGWLVFANVFEVMFGFAILLLASLVPIRKSGGLIAETLLLAGIGTLFAALRFPITVERQAEFGALPIVVITGPLTTRLPEDPVIIDSTEISGTTDFEEIVVEDALDHFPDPLKEKLQAL